MNYKCQAISSGVAYGKIGYLTKQTNYHSEADDECNQIDLFDNAIKFVSDDLNEEILDSKQNVNERISEIFQTHKYIINDPILILKTKEYIAHQNLSAQKAYDKAVADVIHQFEQIENEYMLGRIVDIIDATDHVKAALKSIEKERIGIFDEPTILILKQLKPSIIYNIKKSNIVGFIAEHGFYHQHSGIIARTFNVPGMICEKIYDRVQGFTHIELDCDHETYTLYKTGGKR